MRKKEDYDLEERTAVFGEATIEFCMSVPETSVTRPLISQLVRAGTSVGANYCEADDAQSPKDFRHKIALCRKESRESSYWYRMITQAVPQLRDPAEVGRQEAHELNLIFSSIFRKTAPSK